MNHAALRYHNSWLYWSRSSEMVWKNVTRAPLSWCKKNQVQIFCPHTSAIFQATAHSQQKEKMFNLAATSNFQIVKCPNNLPPQRPMTHWGIVYKEDMSCASDCAVKPALVPASLDVQRHDDDVHRKAPNHVHLRTNWKEDLRRSQNWTYVETTLLFQNADAWCMQYW